MRAQAVAPEADVDVVSDRHEQADTVAEVEVYGLAGDPGPPGYVGDPDPGPPFLEQGPRGV
jgi:hypothetical protein